MRRGALAALLILLALAGAAWAQPRKDASEIGDRERTLQQKQRQLREERAKAAAARKREASLLTQLEETEKRLAAKRRQVALLDARIRRAQSDIATLQAEIGRLEMQRGGQEEALARRLRAMYKLEVQGGVLPLVLSGADPVAQAVRLRHLTTLAAVDARMIREYRVTSEGLEESRVRMEARRKELAGLRAEVDSERAEADREAGKRRGLLARVKDERAYHDRMVVELSEATRRLEAFIRGLQARQRRAARVPERGRSVPGDMGPGVGLGALRGRLVWPADGRVVGEFGAQVHPRFGTKTFRNGIDIEVAEGTNIAVVYPGHVVYTGWFRGYGNLIIVDHGNDYYTLYAHAADIRVAEGDDVKQGQIIGTVGDTGSLQGPRLYFEVRHQGKPQDPAQWLRPRG
ncbi:MAG: peptidoglycan DD-metalloendopeptidase family protein [Candidatus Rokubacteria bacterium]|nr:peptidoglycan DD-metalloendopeptidase family protein [Candidatus Rokubacteria bacterium]